MTGSATSDRRVLREHVGTAKAIVHWRALTERVETPFGDAETRALGLQTAGRLQSDVGPHAQVVFYAGAPAPYRVDQFDCDDHRPVADRSSGRGNRRQCDSVPSCSTGGRSRDLAVLKVT